jgi:hypothetical protein
VGIDDIAPVDAYGVL